MSARLKPAIALTLVFTAACSDDPVRPANPLPALTPTEGLTQAESVALFRGITELSFGDADPIHAADLIHPGSLVIQCPQGGRMELTETSGESPHDSHGDLSLSFTILSTTCEMTREGRAFIVDGDLDLHSAMDSETVRRGFGEAASITGTIAGDLEWQVLQRSGRCRIQGTLHTWTSILPDPDSQRTGAYFSGSVCGHQVMIDASELLIPPHFPN